MKSPNEPHPLTGAQIKANRENAKKLTGPRTAAGKESSSRNALKHGLSAAKHLLPGEDPEDFLAPVQDLLDRAFPIGGRHLSRPLLRCRSQGQVPPKKLVDEKEYAEQDGDPVPPPPTPPDEGDLLVRAFIADCVGSNSLAKLAPYESVIERSIDRCLRQSEAFQAARNIPDPAADAPEPSKPENYEANPNNRGDAQLCPTLPLHGPDGTGPSQPATGAGPVPPLRGAGYVQYESIDRKPTVSCNQPSLFA